MCPIGGLLSGFFLEELGRKKTLLMINIFSIVSWILLGVAHRSDKDAMLTELLIARVIIGIGIGMSSSPASVYSAEIAHPSLRGSLIMLSPLVISMGMLVIYTLGFFIPEDFRMVSLISCVITITSCLVLAGVPESPTWLISQNREVDAEKVLRLIRGVKNGEPTTKEIYDELNQLKKNLSKNRSQSKLNALQIIKKPEVYKPILIMVFFFAFQQFSGIFVIMVYGAKFAIEAGVSIDPFLCTILIGLTRVLTTFLTMYLSDKFGRRSSAILSSIGMGLCMLGLSFNTWFEVNNEFGWISAVLLIVFVFSATFGLLTLPFGMIGEVFPQQFRGFCAGLTVFAAYVMMFVILKLFPLMLNQMGNAWLFLFYSIISLLACFFVIWVLPETRGKRLQDIEEYFRSGGTVFRNFCNWKTWS